MIGQYNQIGRRDFMWLVVKVGLPSLVGLICSCSKKKPVGSDISDNNSIDKKTVDANESLLLHIWY